MDTFEDDYPKNLYVIRRKLARLHKPPGYGDWQIEVGPYFLSITAPYDADDRDKPFILDYQKVDVYLTEANKLGSRAHIDLRSDPRFYKYQPIIYDTYLSPTGSTVNFGDGHGMPILQLMELIKYLHRLAGLTAFQ